MAIKRLYPQNRTAMKQLHTLRIVLAVMFLAATVAVLWIGVSNPLTHIAERSQIVLSALSITAGATMVWLLLTFIFGRVYCATVCPVGTLSDLALRARRALMPRRRKLFRYRHRSRISLHIAWVYILCIIIGVVGVPFLIEPWNIMRNVAATVRPEAVSMTWGTIGVSYIVGVACGILVLLLILISSWIWGRRFCTDFCPIGIMMGYVANYSLYHIEIDRDACISCGKCEEICRSQCVKVVSQYVDNTRCVRCLDCIDQCPAKAIHIQINRNRPATPLVMRKKVNKTT